MRWVIEAHTDTGIPLYYAGDGAEPWTLEQREALIFDTEHSAHRAIQTYGLIDVRPVPLTIGEGS